MKEKRGGKLGWAELVLVGAAALLSCLLEATDVLLGWVHRKKSSR